MVMVQEKSVRMGKAAWQEGVLKCVQQGKVSAKNEEKLFLHFKNIMVKWKRQQQTAILLLLCGGVYAALPE